MEGVELKNLIQGFFSSFPLTQARIYSDFLMSAESSSNPKWFMWNIKSTLSSPAL